MDPYAIKKRSLNYMRKKIYVKTRKLSFVVNKRFSWEQKPSQHSRDSGADKEIRGRASSCT